MLHSDHAFSSPSPGRIQGEEKRGGKGEVRSRFSGPARTVQLFYIIRKKAAGMRN